MANYVKFGSAVIQIGPRQKPRRISGAPVKTLGSYSLMSIDGLVVSGCVQGKY